LQLALAELEAGRLTCKPQPQEGVTYAHKLDKSETRLDFSKPSLDVLRHIHGLSPHPGAWFQLPDGQRVKVLRALPAEGTAIPGVILDDHLTVACREGAVRLLVLQREGKSAMDSEAFLRGLPIPRGTRLA
jgi:methionyl-tRNA formyltransferase